MSVIVEGIVGPTTYALSGGNPFWFVSLTGGGLPPIRRLKERSPQQHGSTDIGFLLDERMINLVLLIEANATTQQEALELADQYRDDLAECLKPRENTPIQLRITRDDGRVRQIDCHVVGTVDFPNTLRERMGASQLVVIQFEAADPIFYDPTLNNVIFDISDNVSGVEIPLMIPFVYSAVTELDAIESITYAGKWETFPIIYVTGPANDLIITNETTGKVLDFTGHNIASGDIYTIDLRYGQRFIVDQNGVRKNSALTDDSDLQNWSFVPGINDVHVEITSGLSVVTLIRVEYYNRYPSA